jgi:pyrroloquinoline quinone biosynthesis protein E
MCLVSFSRTENYKSLEKIRKFKGDPLWVYLSILDQCSLECSYCYNSSRARKGRVLKKEAFEKILESSKNLGISQITISGGEPLEHPDYIYFLKRCVEEGMQTHLATNGTLLSDSEIEKLIKTGISQIQFNWQAVLFNDSRFSEFVARLQAHGIQIVTNTTLNQTNWENLENLIERASELKVDRIRFWDCTGKGKPDLPDKNIGKLFQRAEELCTRKGYTHSLSYDPDYKAHVHVPCLQLQGLFLYVDPSGDILFCGAMDEKIRISSIYENRDQIIQAVKTMNQKISSQHGFCCMAREKGSRR